MNPEEMVQTQAEVEVVREEQQAPEAAQEQEKSFWEQAGFLEDIARVVEGLEAEPEKFMYSAATRQIFETINNAKVVSDLDRYDEDQLQSFISRIRENVPAAQQQIVTFQRNIGRARIVQSEEVDFI